MTVWIHHRLSISVRLHSEVTRYLSEQRQIHRRDTEAGGPLFSNVPGQDFEVDSCAGPFSRDRRTRHGYIPHRPSVQEEIENRHTIGQHFIGTWHTHPSLRATASEPDVRSIRNLFEKSVHDLNLFVMIIVGTDPVPSSWEVSAFGNFGRIVLTPTEHLTQLNGEK